MSYFQKRQIYGLALCILLTATLTFIFHNSNQAGAASSQSSQQVTRAILGDSPASGTAEPLVRKIAHLLEYALLGFWFVLLLKVQDLFSKQTLFLCLGIGLLVAAADEINQSTLPGRHGAFQDVLLDLAGFALGMGLAWMLSEIYLRLVKKKA